MIDFSLGCFSALFLLVVVFILLVMAGRSCSSAIDTTWDSVKDLPVPISIPEVETDLDEDCDGECLTPFERGRRDAREGRGWNPPTIKFKSTQKKNPN